MNSLPFGQLKSFLKILIGVQYQNAAGLYCIRKGRALPEKLAREEPFATLSYADDCLPYGDEAQCRRLYEAAFDHYARG